MNIEHNEKLICVHDFSPNGDFFLYFFTLKNGGLSIHSIESYGARGKSNTYKKEELFHFGYKRIFDHEKGVFVEPVIPNHVMEMAEMFKLSFIIKSIK